MYLMAYFWKFWYFQPKILVANKYEANLDRRTWEEKLGTFGKVIVCVNHLLYHPSSIIINHVFFLFHPSFWSMCAPYHTIKNCSPKYCCVVSTRDTLMVDHSMNATNFMRTCRPTNPSQSCYDFRHLDRIEHLMILNL